MPPSGTELVRQITEALKDTRQAFGALQDDNRRTEARLSEQIADLKERLGQISAICAEQKTSVEVVKVKVSTIEDKFEDKIKVLHHRLTDGENKQRDNKALWLAILALLVGAAQAIFSFFGKN